jgi:hypothetical protein
MAKLATLNLAAIAEAIASFGRPGGWQEIRCASCLAGDGNPDAPDWRTVSGKRIPKDDGLYAFLLPRAAFPAPFRFSLFAPRKKKAKAKKKSRKPTISFEVRVDELPEFRDGMFVAYVGRTTRLRKRLQEHFQRTKDSSCAQVRKAIKACLKTTSSKKAIKFMLANAQILYYPLPGKENVANRDIIEVALWAEFHTPFNVKSER